MLSSAGCSTSAVHLCSWLDCVRGGIQPFLPEIQVIMNMHIQLTFRNYSEICRLNDLLFSYPDLGIIYSYNGTP